MPEQRTTRPSHANPQQNPHHGPWRAACDALMEGNQPAVARWMRAFVALAQEIPQFTQERLEEDVATWSALAACRTPGEALECQRRFAATATEQYYDQLTKLSQMTMRAA